MSGADILTELVIVLGTAMVVTVVFQALRLPVVLGYILAGLVIGPHVPVPLVADADLVHELSELGVILLMFTIGLELPLAKVRQVGATGAVTAIFEVAVVIAAGTLVAMLVGFDPGPAVFAGACLGISSTMLVAKAFDEHGWKGGFTDTVFAILVFEDVIAIVLLAGIGAIATGAGLDGHAMAILAVKLVGFLVIALVGGLLAIPRIVRRIATKSRRETLVITALLVCFGLAALAEHAGFSVALGAFIAGVLVAESGHGHDILKLVEVPRDVFAMIFFVSVGMTIDPAMLASEAPRIAAFTAVVIVFKPLGVATGSFLAGSDLKTAARAGLSLSQIGEFSFVLAGVLGDPALLAIAVGVSCATTLTSSIFIRSSERMAGFAVAHLPGRIATFVSFYESWLARMRSSPKRTRHTRPIAVLAISVAAIVGLAIAGATLGGEALEDVGVHGHARTALQVAAVALASAPFAVAMTRTIVGLARSLALDVVPVKGDTDTGHAPRRMLGMTFGLGITLVVIAPIAAAVQAWVPGSFLALLAGALVVLVVARRSVQRFEDHVHDAPETEGVTTATVAGEAVGRTLADLDLRALTGATVLAIRRGGECLETPSPKEPLRAGDVLSLAGSDEAVVAARGVLGA